MTAETLLQEARAAGARLVAADGRVQVSGQLPEDLLSRLRQHRTELLALLHQEAYGDVGRSNLTRRYREALPWLLTRRPELHQKVRTLDLGPTQTDVQAFEAALRTGVEAFEATSQELFS